MPELIYNDPAELAQVIDDYEDAMKDLAIIDVLGHALKISGELVSLTDLWKGQGSEQRNRPKAWLATDATGNLLAELAKSVKGQNPALWEARRGNSGGTYAHWQLALAYAQYLSPKLHLAVNDVFRRFTTADVALTENLITRTESAADLLRLDARVKVRISNKALGSAIRANGGEAC